MMAIICAGTFLTVLCLVLFVWNTARGTKGDLDDHLGKWLQQTGNQKTVSPALEKHQRVSDVPVLERFLRPLSPMATWHTWVQQSGISLSPVSVILFSLLLGSLTFFISLGSRLEAFLWVPLTGLACGLPFGIVLFLRKRRQKLFSAAFPNAVSRMASALRAGYSLQMALDSVVKDSGSLIGAEFQKVLSEMGVGQSFETALTRMTDRIDTQDLRLFIASVLIQRESGGNLTEVLDNLEATIRERFELQRELEAASSQAKLSGIILSLLPVFVGCALYLIHKDYILFLFQDTIGQSLFKLSIVGQVLGILTIRKIVQIEM